MSFMIKEKLFTRDGQYVVEVVMPPFNPRPEAIVWGSRIFIRVDTDLVTGGEDGEAYIEGFVWVSPDGLLTPGERNEKLKPYRPETKTNEYPYRADVPGGIGGDTPVADSIRAQAQEEGFLTAQMPEEFLAEMKALPNACSSCGAYGGAHKLQCPQSPGIFDKAG